MGIDKVCNVEETLPLCCLMPLCRLSAPLSQRQCYSRATPPQLKRRHPHLSARVVRTAGWTVAGKSISRHDWRETGTRRGLFHLCDRVSETCSSNHNPVLLSASMRARRDAHPLDMHCYTRHAGPISSLGIFCSSERRTHGGPHELLQSRPQRSFQEPSRPADETSSTKLLLTSSWDCLNCPP